jgi:hypothetical protein
MSVTNMVAIYDLVGGTVIVSVIPRPLRAGAEGGHTLMRADSVRRLGLTPWMCAGRDVGHGYRSRLRRLTVLLLAAAAVVPVDTIVGSLAWTLTAVATVVAGLVLVAIWRWRHRARQLEQILSDELDHRTRS